MAVTTYSWMSAPTQGTDVDFRKWCQGIHDALVATGWAQTSDTGQVDLATVSRPTTAAQVAGYEVWRLNDALQATAPVFLKIEYMKGGSTVNNVALGITVAQATNGSGTLSSFLFTRSVTFTSTSALGSATEYASYASGDGSSFCLVLWPGLNTAICVALTIERSRNVSGDATGDAVLISVASSATQRFVITGIGGADGSSMNSEGVFAPITFPRKINGSTAVTGDTLSKDGVVAPVLPIPCMAPGVEPWVSNVIVGVHPGDAGTTSVIQAATINGETRVYRAFPITTSTAGLIPLSLTTSTHLYAIAAILWDEE